jgi:hypothetical protein
MDDEGTHIGFKHGGEIVIGPNAEEIELLDIDGDCRAIVALEPNEVERIIKALVEASE